MDRTVHFILKGEEQEVEITDVDQSNMDEEFATQAGQFYYLAAAHAWAERNEKAAKYELDTVYAQLDTAYRATLSGKVTEKIVESNILTDARYVDYQNKYLDALENAGKLRGACDAMRQRKDMLVQLGAQRRAEANAGFGTT